jgi:hypothetical protein
VSKRLLTEQQSHILIMDFPAAKLLPSEEAGHKISARQR